MFVYNDFIVNGQGHGAVGQQMQEARYDPGLLRPYFDKNGRPAVTINLGRTTLVKGEQRPIREHRTVAELVNNYGIMSPVFNATALRKEEWTELDKRVILAARYRQRAWLDLSSANTYSINGMGKMILEHETMSDPGEAMEDMEAMTDGRSDEPRFQLQGLPLPITHADFWMSERKRAVSQNSGVSLDTRMAEATAERVAERVEKVTIGVTTGIIYGGNSTQVGGYGRTSQVCGYTNFPARLTKTNLTTPTGSNPEVTINEVLAMLDTLYAQKFYGPFMLYVSNDWSKFLGADYILTGGNVATQTLGQRLKSIENISDVRRLDFLFGTQPSSSTGPGGDVDVTLKPYTMILVQLTPNVARAVNGMAMTTVQWPSKGGMRLNFKVMCIQVPQLFADYYGNTGIMHATTS